MTVPVKTKKLREISGENAPIDLQPRYEHWPEVQVPPGWEPLAAVCRDLHARSDPLAERITRCIMAEIPPHSDERVVPFDDLYTVALRTLQSGMVALAERRGADAEDMSTLGELGRRRASQGAPIDAVLQGYQVGYREVWDAFVRRARDQGEAPTALLPEAAAAIWSWVYDITHAVTDAYTEPARAREAYVAGLRRQFLDSLLAGQPATPDLTDLARVLGFDPDGRFQALCVRPLSPESTRVGWLLAEMRLNVGQAVDLFPHGRELIFLTQARDPAATLGILEQRLPGVAIGVGAQRSGLAGARLTTIDARAAAHIARQRGKTTKFTEDWFAAMVHEHEYQLGDPLSEGIALARNESHLAEAVAMYCHAGFSLSRVARELHLHPNSVGYRLDRWHQLSGWDPRELAGALNSLAAIQLAGRTDDDDGSHEPSVT